MRLCVITEKWCRYTMMVSDGALWPFGSVPTMSWAHADMVRVARVPNITPVHFHALLTPLFDDPLPLTMVVALTQKLTNKAMRQAAGNPHAPHLDWPLWIHKPVDDSDVSVHTFVPQHGWYEARWRGEDMIAVHPLRPTGVLFRAAPLGTDPVGIMEALAPIIGAGAVARYRHTLMLQRQTTRKPRIARR
jgi:hypothetical protein